MQVRNIQNQNFRQNISRTKAQSQTFGAIRVKGLEPNSPTAIKVMQIADEYYSDIEFGKTLVGKVYRYITTLKDTATEHMVFREIKKILPNNKKVSAKICSDEVAARNIKSFDDDVDFAENFFAKSQTNPDFLTQKEKI